jgi:hypothetical protein
MPVSLFKRLSLSQRSLFESRAKPYSIVSILTVLRTLALPRNSKKLRTRPCTGYPDFLPFSVLLSGTGSEIHRKCRLSYFYSDFWRNTRRLFVI